MIDISTIKLIIWDLDDTLWSGTLSEGGAVMTSEMVQLIRDLTDCGIVNSICSKNDWGPVQDKLEGLGIWESFVFPSINWESKGPQIKDKLEKMALRPVNVLFLDDNVSNLGEAIHYLPDIQVGGPEIIKDLILQTFQIDKKDPGHKRLKQYKILEEKDRASQSYSSSEDFLYASNIRVAIHNDCTTQIKRIHELLLRSNQLNFTKKRIGIDELESILKNNLYDCGYVTVTDRFGDYGLVGFYAKKGSELDHFFFSCRTMGQKIEQYVYAQLGFPELTVVGDVRTQLNCYECPGWINNNEINESELTSNTLKETVTVQGRVLMKGPCDLSHSVVYLKSAYPIDTEFTYVNETDGRIIDAYNHSVHIEGLYTHSQIDKDQIVHDCPFVDPSMLNGSFFSGSYDMIFLSTLIESKYLVYQKKGTEIKVVFGGADLTNKANWNGLTNGSYYTGGNHFTTSFLQTFSENYVCKGYTTPESYIAFLEKCLQWLPERTHLCLILGSTVYYKGDEELKRRHRLLNDAIIDFASNHPRINYIELDRCIHDVSDYEDSLDHFSTRVYYNLAQEIIKTVQSATGKKIESFSSKLVIFDSAVLKVRKWIKRFFKEDSHLYLMMKKVYNKVYKQR